MFDTSGDGRSIGGTLVSRHSRIGTLTSVDALAKELREYHNQDKANDKPNFSGPEGQAKPTETCSSSSTFHHFRFVVVFLMGISLALMLTMRYGITISVLRMVNQTHMYLQEHPNRTVDDFLDEGYMLGGEFNWNNEIVSIICSWYMFSYTIPQVFTTQIALRIGCHNSVPISLAICAFSQLITPMLAYFGWQYVVFARLLNGLGASAMAAVSLNIVETWVRPEEIQWSLALIQSCCAASMFTPVLIGYLTDIHWVYSFYVPAIISLLFCVLWYFVAADRPEESRLISQDELAHIKIGQASVLGSDNGQGQVKSNENDCNSMSASLRIFKVPSFYAYLVCWTIACCTNHGYLFALPTYLRQFLKIGVAENGFYGSIISLGCFLTIIWPQVCHRYLVKAGLSVTNSRRIIQTICCTGITFTWLYVGLYHDNQILAFFLNRCFVGTNDVLIPASLMSNFGQAGLTSVAFSVMNSIADVLIVPTSSSIGWLLDYTGQSRECWSWVFAVIGLAHVVLWFIFVVFIDSKPIEFKADAKTSGSGNKKSDELEGGK